MRAAWHNPSFKIIKAYKIEKKMKKNTLTFNRGVLSGHAPNSFFFRKLPQKYVVTGNGMGCYKPYTILASLKSMSD